MARLDTRQHFVQIVTPRDAQKALAVERIQMDVDAAQAGVIQRRASSGQQDAVGGQRQVADARNGRQLADEYRQVAAHQRLPAGDPQLGDAQPCRHPREAFDLFEIQDLAALHELHDVSGMQ